MRNSLVEGTNPEYQFLQQLVKKCLLGKKKERGKQIMKIMKIGAILNHISSLMLVKEEG